MRSIDVTTYTGPVLDVGAVTSTALVEHRLLDDLIGSNQNRLRDGEAESLCRLHVDDEFELGGLLDRGITRLGAFEDSVNVIRGTM
jgi:hypothetical protein